jgi:hypothetical protein
VSTGIWKLFKKPTGFVARAMGEARDVEAQSPNLTKIRTETG